MPPRPVGDDIVNVAVRFPADMHEEMKQRAAEEDLTLSQLLRRLARNYLSSRESVPV